MAGTSIRSNGTSAVEQRNCDFQSGGAERLNAVALLPGLRRADVFFALMQAPVSINISPRY
jgi:hypothetical protein